MATKPSKHTEAPPAGVARSDGAAAEATATPEAHGAQPGPAAVRRNVKPPDDTRAADEQAQLDAMAEHLAGVADSDEHPEPKPTPGRQTQPAASHADQQPAPADNSQAAPEEQDEFDPEGPVIPSEGDADEDEADATAGEGKDNDRTGKSPEEVVKHLDSKLYQMREQRRELRKQLEAAQTRERELSDKLQRLETLPPESGGFGPYAGARSETEIDQIAARVQQELDWYDDYEDGYDGPGPDGKEVSYDRAQIRAWRRQAAADLRLADAARTALQIARSSEQAARKKYPFVFDPQSKLHTGILDLVTETPALNKLPNKALLLGRLRVGMLVESGEYMLVKRAAKKAVNGNGKQTGGGQPPAPRPSHPPATDRRPPASRPAADDLHERIERGDKQALEEWAESLIPESVT